VRHGGRRGGARRRGGSEAAAAASDWRVVRGDLAGGLGVGVLVCGVASLRVRAACLPASVGGGRRRSSLPVSGLGCLAVKAARDRRIDVSVIHVFFFLRTVIHAFEKSTVRSCVLA
jgi:hypothetical protein